MASSSQFVLLSSSMLAVTVAFAITSFTFQLISNIAAAADTLVPGSAVDCFKMGEKKVVPAIESFADFNDKLSGYLDKSHQLALLLDYDGTLAPLAERPEYTAMPPETEQTLNWLVLNPQIFVAVISGRELKSVKGKVNIKNITYAGNHGLEIENPDGTRSDYELPSDIKENYTKLRDELNNKVAKHGAWVEDKTVSLTFHYLEVPKELQDDLISEARKIIESNGFRASPAHFAIEAKPPVNWNKGEAAKLILKNKFGDNWQSLVKVVFAGDDTTDEDIMRAIHGVGKSFRVSTNPNIETCADYRLNSPNEVTLLLKWLKSIYE